MRIELLDRMSTEHSLHRALERSELMLHYQPVVEIAGVTTVGVEALIRWQHPDQGLVAPYRFIPVAEESGLDHPHRGVGARAGVPSAARLAATGIARVHRARWRSTSRPARSTTPGSCARSSGSSTRTGLPPEHLTLEITESALMKDAAAALGVLRALKELGVQLAIDDFGTGYSSLSYLQRFPLDILKIDQSLRRDLGGEQRWRGDRLGGHRSGPRPRAEGGGRRGGEHVAVADPQVTRAVIWPRGSCSQTPAGRGHRLRLRVADERLTTWGPCTGVPGVPGPTSAGSHHRGITSRDGGI